MRTHHDTSLQAPTKTSLSLIIGDALDKGSAFSK